MGILSWRGSKSLDAALSSYAKENLFSLFDSCVIVLPDPDETIRKVAQKYPLVIHELPENIGIAGGMKAVANALDTDYVLFLENDCPLVENFAEAQRQIQLSINALQSNAALMARLRSRRLPGEHFTTLEKYRRYWDESVFANLRKNLRPAKAKRLSGSAIYAGSNPVKKHPDNIQFYKQDTTSTSYLVEAEVMPWTNQSILIRRKTFLETIMPYVESRPLRRAINGFHNVEIELNQSKFWVNSNFRIFCPSGLFTHQRLEHRGYV